MDDDVGAVEGGAQGVGVTDVAPELLDRTVGARRVAREADHAADPVVRGQQREETRGQRAVEPVTATASVRCVVIVGTSSGAGSRGRSGETGRQRRVAG
ncbi:hypothetical protein [Cryptosporangium aurantiacum]|uniref:hypothetical protein n=1 Tax=Cryptosporangium aurantiacum TaxID=134849 RepID=UPI0009330B31|nr:hypothetical protein [Cryptosporangium aurantiacum]